MFDAEPLTQVVGILSEVTEDLRPSALSGPEAAGIVEQAVTIVRLGEALVRMGARGVEHTGYHRRLGYPSVADWLAGRTGESVPEARRDLDTQRNLERSPKVDRAARNGGLSRNRANEVAGGAAASPERTDELLHTAEEGSLADLRKQAEDARRAARDEEDEEERRRAAHASRFCRSWVDKEGKAHLRAELTTDALARLDAALESGATELLAEARRAGESPESFLAYRADALVALAARPDAASHAPLAQVRLLVDVEALRRGELQNAEQCLIPGVGSVSLATARALLGDATLRLVIRDGVDVLSVCHLGRSIPEAVKTALDVRDPRCVVPGCGRVYSLQYHHWQQSYADGGPSTLANLARICAAHHDQCTYLGHRLAGGPGHWRFLDRDANLVAGVAADPQPEAAQSGAQGTPKDPSARENPGASASPRASESPRAREDPRTSERADRHEPSSAREPASPDEPACPDEPADPNASKAPPKAAAATAATVPAAKGSAASRSGHRRRRRTSGDGGEGARPQAFDFGTGPPAA